MHQGRQGHADEILPTLPHQIAEMVVAVFDRACHVDLHQSLAHVLRQAPEKLSLRARLSLASLRRLTSSTNPSKYMTLP